MKKLKILIIVIVLLVLANMTVMVFLSGGSKMAENNGATVFNKAERFYKNSYNTVNDKRRLIC